MVKLHLKVIEEEIAIVQEEMSPSACILTTRDYA